MKHLHFEEIPSTQNYLCENKHLLDSNCLVSCDRQINGIGQYGRQWDSNSQSLCFSFTIDPNSILTLTSLEVACLTVKYFKQLHEIELKVKWPNDILTDSGKKVGGILLNNINKKLVVGVGLNLFESDLKKDYKTPAGFIFTRSFEFNYKDYAADIYKFLIDHRISPEEVLKFWTSHCIHLNKNISIEDGEKIYKGIFLGLGENGEALINVDGSSVKKFYSGSVRI